MKIGLNLPIMPAQSALLVDISEHTEHQDRQNG